MLGRWKCSCFVVGNVRASLASVEFMVFDFTIPIFVARSYWRSPLYCAAHGVSRNWCGDLAKNGVSDSEAIRAGTNMSTDWNVIWCYNHDESVAESNEPVSQKTRREIDSEGDLSGWCCGGEAR